MHQPELPGVEGRRSSAVEPGGLLVPGPGGRYAALLAEHQRLLQRVAGQRERLRRLDEELRALGNRMASVLEPLRDRMLELDREIHALFGELLAPRRLSRQARRQVSLLYRFLQEQEVLSPAPAARPGPVADESIPWDDPSPVTDPPAKRSPGRGLRELFLGLAKVLHPDKAQGAADLAARTDAMKEVNQAYREGDLGRLLELERAWAGDHAAVASPDEVERRCQALERINRELRAQGKELARQEKELRRSEVGQFIQQGKRRHQGMDLLASLEAEGREHVEKLIAVRDLVRRFRDGEVSLDQLLAGPGNPDEELDEDLDLDVLAELARLAVELEAGRQPGRGRKRRRRTRRR